MIASDFWNTVTEFFDAYGILLTILLTVVIAVIVRMVLIAIVNKFVRDVVSGAKKLRDKQDARGTETKRSRRELVPSPLTAERIVQRTQTLGAFSRNVITVFVILIAVFVILDELGVNLTALLASAGIIAAGLAFGAQSVVKDILNGMFMVFEDQLGVGDSVTIGDVDGTVEVVGIRITQVRAYDGTLWFIRNGEILRVGNLSHGWGRAVFDISVDAASDLNQVREIILKTVNAAVLDPVIASKTIAQPEIMGLQQISEERATIRVSVKTRPDAQGEVLTHLRTEIKTSFDAAGIRLAPERSALLIRPESDRASEPANESRSSKTSELENE